MAKKKETKVEVMEPQVEKIIPKPKEVLKPKDEWEIKDRLYYLKDKTKPLSRSIKSAGIYWFDEQVGYERELKYCENQKTSFVDEMKGEQRLAHIVFRNGVLQVPRNKQTLQKLLSLYHPHRNILYEEFEPVKKAASEIETLEMEVEALMIAKDLDIDMVEAIMRTEVGSEVDKMSSKELKRDLLLFAKKNPKLLLELANDENVQLRNFGIKATELGILSLSSDQRYFYWKSNNRKLMTIPFDEHPYSALAAWFKTDEGMEIYSNIEKRLN